MFAFFFLFCFFFISHHELYCRGARKKGFRHPRIFYTTKPPRKPRFAQPLALPRRFCISSSFHSPTIASTRAHYIRLLSSRPSRTPHFCKLASTFFEPSIYRPNQHKITDTSQEISVHTITSPTSNQNTTNKMPYYDSYTTASSSSSKGNPLPYPSFPSLPFPSVPILGLSN